LIFVNKNGKRTMSNDDYNDISNNDQDNNHIV